VAELERLSTLVAADRPNVRKILADQVVFVKSKIPAPSAPVETPKPASVSSPSPSSGDLHYETISGYAWENLDKSVKVYIDMPEVGTLPADKITSTIYKSDGGQGLLLLVHDFKNKNYRLRIPSLFGKVSNVTVNQRANRLVLTLNKEGTAFWSSLLASKDKPKEKEPDLDKDDPSNGIMNMMQKLYAEGDEEMKRTIAKAWTESKDKKGALPF